jgi:hypothetical protein
MRLPRNGSGGERPKKGRVVGIVVGETERVEAARAGGVLIYKVR